MKTLRSRPDLAQSAMHFTRACAASRAHEALAKAMLAAYGDRGPSISGSVRGHFPWMVGEALSLLARQITAESEAAWEARPARVQDHTMRRLSQEIARADGSGFYGPKG